MKPNSEPQGMEPEINQSLLWILLKYLKSHDEGVGKRELYFTRADFADLPLVPEGKVLRVTLDFVPLSKIENRAE